MFDSPETPYIDDIDIQDLESMHVVDLTGSDTAPTLVVQAEAVDAADGLSDLYSSTERSFPCSGRTQLFFAPPGERRVRRESVKRLPARTATSAVSKRCARSPGVLGANTASGAAKTTKNVPPLGMHPCSRTARQSCVQPKRRKNTHP